MPHFTTYQSQSITCHNFKHINFDVAEDAGYKKLLVGYDYEPMILIHSVKVMYSLDGIPLKAYMGLTLLIFKRAHVKHYGEYNKLNGSS